jgi:hypothetical protein
MPSVVASRVHFSGMMEMAHWQTGNTDILAQLLIILILVLSFGRSGRVRQIKGEINCFLSILFQWNGSANRNVIGSTELCDDTVPYQWMVPYNFRRLPRARSSCWLWRCCNVKRVSLAISVGPFGLYAYAARRHPRLGTTW